MGIHSTIIPYTLLNLSLPLGRQVDNIEALFEPTKETKLYMIDN